MNIAERLQRLERRQPFVLDTEAALLIDAAILQYNTPEAEAERDTLYLDIQQIGQQRRDAYQRGEPMQSYPLPWESEPDEHFRTIETA